MNFAVSFYKSQTFIFNFSMCHPYLRASLTCLVF